MVSHIDTAVQTLQARGVTIATQHGSVDEGARSANFTNPDGYSLYLMQREGYEKDLTQQV